MLIGFLGYNRQQTYNNFQSFLEINKDIIASRHELQAVLKDGDIIQCIFKDNPSTAGFRYDYIILSDDSRMSIETKLDEYDINWTCNIPFEFRIMIDNIDLGE